MAEERDDADGQTEVQCIETEVETDLDRTGFTVGDLFFNYEDVSKRLEAYERATFTKFWKRDARTVAAASKRLARTISPSLKYYEVKFCCIHGGQSFRPQGKGQRNTWTFKQDCPVNISLRANAAGDALEVKSLCLEHSHDLSQELFNHLPQQRRLPKEVKEKAAKLLEMKANNKLVQQTLCQETGKVILLKDLANINNTRKRQETRNDLNATVNLLTDKYGASVEVFCNKDNEFRGLFFQDLQMREAFDAYPEIVFVDATYKLLQLGVPIYLFLCEDSNGLSEVVGVAMLVTEDADGMQWMVDAFKKYNSRWEKIRVVMADKDIGEQDVLKKCLPSAKILICLFHTLRSFRREISCDKLGISSGARTVSLELIQKMAYAKSEAEYNSLYVQFQRDAPKQVLEYFDECWHPIKDEWVMGIAACSGTFLNTTNNRLESINGKLKQVISRNSSLEEFISHFFVILTALRTERDHKAAVMFQKTKVQPFSQGSPESEYTKLLTLYASTLVLKQLELAKKVKEIKEDNGRYIVQTSEGERTVSLEKCACGFYSSICLPCRHIFALRIKLGKPLYDPTVCEQRWTTAYYKSTQRIFSTSQETASLSVVKSCNKRRVLSQHEKYRKAVVISSELASVASVAFHIHFKRRLKLLRDLTDYWKRGEEVGLIEINRGSSDEASEYDDDSEGEVSRSPSNTSENADYETVFDSQPSSIFNATSVSSPPQETVVNAVSCQATVVSASSSQVTVVNAVSSQPLATVVNAVSSQAGVANTAFGQPQVVVNTVSSHPQAAMVNTAFSQPQAVVNTVSCHPQAVVVNAAFSQPQATVFNERNCTSVLRAQ
ncbi:zinc finger SWIM domain-containing protein 3-like isoform X3 [Dysidea avara]|uniref:zinc finger SWIM domain-containing protein 3-like isoform X3 n=1 Tax=Dysidea avara TaxID=196820 RepID=UPI00331C387E